MPDGPLPSYWSPPVAALGRRTGLTDQYLRVWRLILFQAQSEAMNLGFDVPPWQQLPADYLSGRIAPPTVETAPYWIVEGDSIFSSEVPTGQYPGLQERAAGLRIHFTVTKTANQTANVAEVTIYNLTKDTVTSLIREFNYCILQAGYEYGQAGSIFSGTIKMYKTGHENTTDSYLKIYAADGDMGICNGIVNHSYPPGTAPDQFVKDAVAAMQQHGDVYPGSIDPSAIITPTNARTKVHYGMASDIMRDFAQANSALWYVLDQKFYWAKPTAYQEGTAVNLNAATGLIGFPEMTQDGINITTLINPAIRLNQLVRLDNAYINQYWTPGGYSGAVYQTEGSAEKQVYFPVQGDGLYAVKTINYEGDSRGQQWYQYMVCLAVDASVQNTLLSVLAGFDWSQL